MQKEHLFGIDTLKDKIEYYTYVYGTTIRKIEEELNIRRGAIERDEGAGLSPEELKALAKRFNTTVELLTRI